MARPPAAPARLQSWLLWVAGVMAILGSVGLGSVELEVLFLRFRVLMVVVGLFCLAAAFIVSERANLENEQPTLSRRVRIWALIVMGVASLASTLPFVGLTAAFLNFRVDLIALVVGLACLFFAYVGTRT
jgi:hypothetical protein